MIAFHVLSDNNIMGHMIIHLDTFYSLQVVICFYEWYPVVFLTLSITDTSCKHTTICEAEKTKLS